jgi:parallel beta helix pectate lyase-like protein
MSTRAAPWLAAALALVIALLVLSGFDSQRGAPALRAADLPPAIGASAVSRMKVAYAGPRVLDGREVLRARVRRPLTRVIAVTFLLDGRPLGSDTTAPHRLDIDASLLAPGRHRLRVEAVDRLGNRARSRPVRVRTGGSAPAAQELTGALAALAHGDVTVRLGPGRHVVRHIQLGSGARLVGSGPRTVLVAAGRAWSLLRVHGHGVRVSDLAIDGAGQAERGIGVASGSRDVRLQRLTVRGITDTAVEVWGAHSDVSVQDSRLDGGGVAGAGVFVLGSDASRASSVLRTRIAGYRAYGINFAQRAYDRPRAALHAVALDNRITGIQDLSAASGTHEGGIWTGGVAAAIVGNHIRDAGTDGIQTVGSSTRVTVAANDIANTPVGIYLEHETTDSLFARNRIADVTTGINVEWRYDNAGSSGNTFVANRIDEPDDAGVFVDVGGDRNRIVGNLIVGGSGPAVVLQGSSHNRVTGNLACARAGERLVELRSAGYEDGSAAHPVGNRVDANREVATCAGR